MIIEQNPKLGYYKVDTRVFYSKPEALIYATEVNKPPLWYFNELPFAKFDWTIEPEESISEIYRRRAQQLRDQYDYIRLECSGGSDSTQTAFSFLLNGIHLDEVVFRYPAHGAKNATYEAFNMKPENTLGEWEFAAKPLLEWIKTHFPKTKVTMQDYSENMVNEDYMKDESWIYTTRDWFQPGHGIKHSHINTSDHRAIADSGKSICALYGIDKPKLSLMDGGWYMYFVDIHANHPHPVVDSYTNITSELFFWTPDMPELMSKQAHLIRRWFDMPQNQHLKHIIHYVTNSVNWRTTYENLIKTVIYPDYDPKTWQTVKATNSFYNEMDHWFHVNFAESELYSAWASGLQLLADKIDRKYFVSSMGKVNGLVFYRSPMYYIGPEVVTQTHTPAFKNVVAPSKNEEIKIFKDKKIKKIIV